jgi:ribonucleoside-diphosphate reductase alpha chain
MINNWIEGEDYPNWMIEEGLKTLSRQHLMEGETPKEMYHRISSTLSAQLASMLMANSDWTIDDIVEYVDKTEEKWFNYMWNGWLCPSTPILANCGTNRGFTIACFIARVPDSISGIYDKLKETALLTKMGGGVGITFDKVRGRGEPISVGGFTEGTIPFIKVYDSAVVATTQATARRGAISINLPVRHKDINEFLKIRLPIGDVNRQSLNVNHCVTIDDYFYESLLSGDQSAREVWSEILSTRMKTGQPYIFNYHNANKNKPDDFKKRNLKIDGSNICTEIMAPHDFDHTVVCDLASINLTKWDEFKDNPEFIELALLFLDANLELFVNSATDKDGFDNAVRFAKKARLLGLGVLGWHTFLQSKLIPFNSITTRSWIRKIAGKMHGDGQQYNKKWGKILGNPEWCDENRNTTLFAIAPTTTNSLVSGGVSQGIEPLICNAWVQKSAKGTFIRKNKYFQRLMQRKYKEFDTDQLWDEIMVKYQGSVQHLEFLTDEEKEVFLTAYEINQLELVKSAAIWQQYIDQGISLNLFFPADVDGKWFNKVHLTAWEEGLKSLYYVRTESILSRNMKTSTFSDCLYCEG